MAYRSLGSATTNAYGVAELNFIGRGRGKLNIVASTSETITSSSLVSPEYELIDAIFYDDGISGTASWDTAQATVDRTSGQYTELTSSSTSFQFEGISDDICIEFDYYCTDTSEKGISIRQGTTEVWSRTLTQLNVNTNTWCHVKIELTDGNYSIWVDGVDKTPSSHTISSFNRFFFRVTSSYSIRYKDFVIYPI